MTSAVPIKVGMPVSCDYAFPYQSLPLIYEHADWILWAADPTGRTQTGTPFSATDSFWDWIRTIDTHGKINLYWEDISRPAFRTMEKGMRR